MSRSVKLVLYLIFLTGACVLGWKFYRTYTQAAAQAATKHQEANAEPTNSPPDQLTVTNATTVTNAPATNVVATGTATNAIGTNAVTAAPAPASVTYSTMMGYGFGAFLMLVGLCLLAARDVAQFFGNRAETLLFNDDGVGLHTPEYENAEQVWADGHHLEAVQLMREYLKKYPREQYVALRIAEIYETDLKNYLAAALEYEEVLTKKLPPERWGWAAIHLANLYSGRLNKEEKAVALLRRIVDEYGDTAAAKKARERLGTYESPEGAAPVDLQIDESGLAAPPPHKLPPGFRPKK